MVDNNKLNYHVQTCPSGVTKKYLALNKND